MPSRLLDAPPEAPPKPYPLTVAQFVKMDADGYFGHEARVELVQGVLLQRPPMLPPHATATTRLTIVLSRRCGDRYVVRSQAPIDLSLDSMPLPDVTIAVGSWRDDYADAHPTAAQVVLVVEVSKSSLRFDLTVKTAMYAAAKVPEYWVVDVESRRVHVHTLPRRGKNPGYRSVTVVDAAGVIPLALRGEPLGPVAVREFLP